MIHARKPIDLRVGDVARGQKRGQRRAQGDVRADKGEIVLLRVEDARCREVADGGVKLMRAGAVDEVVFGRTAGRRQQRLVDVLAPLREAGERIGLEDRAADEIARS